MSIGTKGIILIIKVKKAKKKKKSNKMSVLKSVRGIIAGSISNSELKYSWMLSGQNNCWFDEENTLSSLFFKGILKNLLKSDLLKCQYKTYILKKTHFLALYLIL